MRKTTKTIAATALILAACTTPIFAKGKAQQKDNNRPKMEQDDERDFDRGRKDGMFKGADLLGTVSSVSADKQIITIKDVDGNETQIHVNPLTRIIKVDEKQLQEKPAERPADKKPAKPEEPPTASISDIKTGDWIAVDKMNTGTKIVEAKGIFVVGK